MSRWYVISPERWPIEKELAAKRPEPTIFSFGYEKQNPYLLWDVAIKYDAIVIDTRLVPRSANADWRLDALMTSAAQKDIQYVWIPQLGNLAYRSKGHEIILAQPAEPLRELEMILTELRRNIILLCYCGNPKHCHRSVIAARLAKRTGLDIVLIKRPKQGEQVGQKQLL